MKITKLQLKQIIKEELDEAIGGDYSMVFEQEKDLEIMTDQELMAMAHQDGVEKFIVLDVEGGLVNRKEIINVLKNIG